MSPRKPPQATESLFLADALIPPWEPISIECLTELSPGWIEERLILLKKRNLHFIRALDAAWVDPEDCGDFFCRNLSRFAQGDHYLTAYVTLLRRLPSSDSPAETLGETVKILTETAETLARIRADLLIVLPPNIRDTVVLAESKIEIGDADVEEHLLQVEKETSGNQEMDGGGPDGHPARGEIQRFLSEIEGSISAKLWERRAECLDFFGDYLIDYAQVTNVSQLDPANVFEFLGTWYIRKVGFSTNHALDTLRSVKQFVSWVDQEYDTDLSRRCRAGFKELAEDLPRAFKVMEALGDIEGARNLYRTFYRDAEPLWSKKAIAGMFGISVRDIDPPEIDEDSVLHDYFEVSAVQGSTVELREFPGGSEPTYRVRFPKSALPWLKAGFIINLAIGQRKGEISGKSSNTDSPIRPRRARISLAPEISSARNRKGCSAGSLS